METTTIEAEQSPMGYLTGPTAQWTTGSMETIEAQQWPTEKRDIDNQQQQREEYIKEQLFQAGYLRMSLNSDMLKAVDMLASAKEEALKIMEASTKREANNIQEDNNEDKGRRHQEAIKKIDEQEEKERARHREAMSWLRKIKEQEGKELARIAAEAQQGT